MRETPAGACGGRGPRDAALYRLVEPTLVAEQSRPYEPPITYKESLPRPPQAPAGVFLKRRVFDPQHNMSTDSEKRPHRYKSPPSPLGPIVFWSLIPFLLPTQVGDSTVARLCTSTRRHPMALWSYALTSPYFHYIFSHR